LAARRRRYLILNSEARVVGPIASHSNGFLQQLTTSGK
jgi:hypothetical protein